MALPMEARRVPQAYMHIGDGGFLNIAYMTGFVIKPDKATHTFKLQQVDNEELALTVHVPPKDRLPAAGRCITAKCHVFGVLRSDGAIVAELRAIDISDANKLSVPTYIAWAGLGGRGDKATIRPKNVGASAIQPYNADGQLKPEIAQQVKENSDVSNEIAEAIGDAKVLDMPEVVEDDGFESVRQILIATRGRLDSKLGENSNVVMFAGVVEKAAIVQRTEFTKEYVALLVKQHGDESRAIPVRLHPDARIPLDIHLRELKPGFPVKVVGRAQEKLIKGENDEIVDRQTYIRCHQLFTPISGKDMLLVGGIPKWWREMCKDIITRRDERRRKLTEGLTAPTPTQQAPESDGLDDLEL